MRASFLTICLFVLPLFSARAEASDIYRGLLRDIPGLNSLSLGYIQRSLPVLRDREIEIVDYQALKQILKSNRLTHAGIAEQVVARLGFRPFTKEKRRYLENPSETVWDEVVILTHQHKSLQVRTAAYLKSAEFQGKPRFLQVSGEFPITSMKLIKEADFILFSGNGSFKASSPPITKKIHAMGGYGHRCLKEALGEILEHSRVHGVSHVDLVLHLDYIHMNRDATLLSELSPGESACRDVLSVVFPTGSSLNDLLQYLGNTGSARGPYQRRDGSVTYHKPATHRFPKFRYNVRLR